MSDKIHGVPWSFPAVDFPLYGLPVDWDLPRRLDHVDGRVGEPPVGVWLWHGRARTMREPWVRVASLPRDRHARSMTPGGGDPVREVAFAATFALVNATFPAPNDRPADFGEQVVTFAERRADEYAQWPAAVWTVDHRSVPARLFGWAGAWAGFTTALPEVDVVAVGFGIEPRALALTEWADTAGYHFDKDLDLAFPEVVDTGRSAALLETDDTERDLRYWPAHPDHDRMRT